MHTPSLPHTVPIGHLGAPNTLHPSLFASIGSSFLTQVPDPLQISSAEHTGPPTMLHALPADGVSVLLAQLSSILGRGQKVGSLAWHSSMALAMHSQL